MAIARPASVDSVRTEQRVRTLLGASATAAAVGVALAVLDSPGVASFVTVGSLAALVYSVHAFGRVGPDAAPASRRRRGRRE